MRGLRMAVLGVALAAPLAFAAVPVVESEGTPVRGPSAPSVERSAPPTESGRAQSPSTQSYPAETTPAESFPAVQAYPAEEATESYPVVAAAPAPEAGGGSPQSELFYQLQTLQVEVQELRGLVEEQRHLIERLERQQKEQYLDLDRRMTTLREGGAAAPPPASGGNISLSPAPTAGTVAAAPSSERDAYTAAFNLTRDKRFQEAIDAFNQMLVDYPSGEYAGNAFYWLGELYLALPTPDLEKSRQSFAQVVGQFPNHAKVPDSLYKLGVVHHRLGDSGRAMEYLEQAQRRFPNTPAARLAQSYAAEIR